MDEEQEHDDDERQATGKVDVVELLCEGGRVDPDEQEEEENDDSATCVFPEWRGCKRSKLAFWIWWGGTMRGW